MFESKIIDCIVFGITVILFIAVSLIPPRPNYKSRPEPKTKPPMKREM